MNDENSFEVLSDDLIDKREAKHLIKKDVYSRTGCFGKMMFNWASSILKQSEHEGFNIDMIGDLPYQETVEWNY